MAKTRARPPKRVRPRARPPETPDDRPRSRTAMVVLVGEIAGAIVAVAGVITLAVNLIDDPEPPERRGTVRIVATQPDTTLGEYLRRRERLGSRPTAEAELPRRLRGTIVEFSLTAVGFRGKEVTTRWSLYDARTNVQLRSSVQADPIAIDADRDTITESTWIQHPAQRRRSYISIELYDDRGTPLSVARTRPFTPR